MPVWATAFPRLHLDPDRLLERVASAALSLVNVPESPDTPTVAASAWAGGLGVAATADGAAVGERLRRLLSEGYRLVVAADGAGSGARLASLLRDAGVDLAARRGGHAPT